MHVPKPTRRRAKVAPIKPTAPVIRWADPSEDPALGPILVSARARARRDIPDVLTSPTALPPEFDELVTLTTQRLRGLQANAQHAAAPHVERVLAYAENAAASPSGDMSDKERSQTSRAVAASQQVETIAEALAIAVEAHLAYARQALALLDATVRHHHRFSTWLEYRVPVIAVPEDLLEIGLARIREADRRQGDESAA